MSQLFFNCWKLYIIYLFLNLYFHSISPSELSPYVILFYFFRNALLITLSNFFTQKKYINMKLNFLKFPVTIGSKNMVLLY